jgi:hypothetical protein
MVDPLKPNIPSVNAKTDNKLSGKKHGPLKRVRKFGRKLAKAVSGKLSKLRIGGNEKAKHNEKLLAMVSKIDPKLQQETEEHKTAIGEQIKASLPDVEQAAPPKPPRTFAEKPPSVPPREAPPPAPTTITDEPPPIPPRSATPPPVPPRAGQQAPAKPPRTLAKVPPPVAPKPKLPKSG